MNKATTWNTARTHSHKETARNKQRYPRKHALCHPVERLASGHDNREVCGAPVHVAAIMSSSHTYSRSQGHSCACNAYGGVPDKRARSSLCHIRRARYTDISEAWTGKATTYVETIDTYAPSLQQASHCHPRSQAPSVHSRVTTQFTPPPPPPPPLRRAQ